MLDTIEKHIEIAAPVERVWRALTDHKEFGAWFRVAIDAPFAVGETSTGRMTYPGYEHLPWRAVIVAMEAPRRFAFDWPPYAVDAGRDYSAEPMTRVEFTLEPIASGTRVTVVESGFAALPPDRRDEAYRSNEGGWTEQMGNIKAHVEA